LGLQAVGYDQHRASGQESVERYAEKGVRRAADARARQQSAPLHAPRQSPHGRSRQDPREQICRRHDGKNLRQRGADRNCFQFRICWLCG